MNKYYNVLLVFWYVSAMLVAVPVGFESSFLNVNEENIWYFETGFLIWGCIMLVINIRRSIRRWVAMRLVNQLPKFKWNTVVSKERIKRVFSYNFLEAFVMICCGTAIFIITPLAWLVFVGLMFGALDGIFFVIYGAKRDRFRVGLTPKALLAGDRDVVIIYFLGLRRISLQQKTLFFDFKEEGMQFRFPIDLIPEEKREEFFTELRESVDQSKVYFSNNISFSEKR